MDYLLEKLIIFYQDVQIYNSLNLYKYKYAIYRKNTH